MEWTFLFVFNSVLLGAGLAMDAFSVSMANGLNEPDMSKRRGAAIAGTFAGFQALMPMTGWFLVRTVSEAFGAFHKLIPWIALILLCFIGGKMLFEGLRSRREGEENAPRPKPGVWTIVLQGIATSIDALSVGFTIADYHAPMALAASLIIAAVTFLICAAGVKIGKVFGTKLARHASVLGGVILIGIGIEIFVSSFID